MTLNSRSPFFRRPRRTTQTPRPLPVTPLAFEPLEQRDLMAVLIANKLADITVTPTSITVGASTPGNNADRVLVIEGTLKSDTISVAPAAAGNFDVSINGQKTTVAGPFKAIVAHGLKGNDAITLDPRLVTQAFLFGGAGKDKLTGAQGNDVLVGGDSNDVLTGGGGRDLLLGGKGTDFLYGNSDISGLDDGDNLLVADRYGQDHSVAMLADLADQWSNANSLTARTAALREAIAPDLLSDKKKDRLYKSRFTDVEVAVFKTKDLVKFATPNVTGAWYSGPTLDKDGFDKFSVESSYQKKTTYIRVLHPTNLPATDTLKTIYVLPVGPKLSRQFGDGLVSVKGLGVVNSTGAIYVAPSFSNMPWFADNDLNPQIRQESYLKFVVAPLVEEIYPVISAPEGRLLLGFSKSGYGAVSMLLRNPEFYGRAYAWDSPLAMTTPRSGWGFPGILGSAQNFENYRIAAQVVRQAQHFQNQPARIFLEGVANARYTDLQATSQLMTSLNVPHVTEVGPLLKHVWNSGWLPDGINLLLS